MGNGQGWSRWEEDELEPPAALAAGMSFWRTEEMGLGGGFPESLEGHDLIRSAQPLLSHHPKISWEEPAGRGAGGQRLSADEVWTMSRSYIFSKPFL